MPYMDVVEMVLKIDPFVFQIIDQKPQIWRHPWWLKRTQINSYHLRRTVAGSIIIIPVVFFFSPCFRGFNRIVGYQTLVGESRFKGIVGDSGLEKASCD